MKMDEHKGTHSDITAWDPHVPQGLVNTVIEIYSQVVLRVSITL